jgi:hypothetical protein
LDIINNNIKGEREDNEEKWIRWQAVDQADLFIHEHAMGGEKKWGERGREYL